MNQQTIDNAERVTFEPLCQNSRIQVVVCYYGEREFVERTIYPHGQQDWITPPQYFYSYWVGNKPVEFKESITGEDPYAEDSYYIVFKTLEEMVEYLDTLPPA